LTENTPGAKTNYEASETLKILIVDDSPADAFLFRQIVKEIGERDVEVDHCTGYEDGLSALQGDVYDIGFIDYHLGHHNGTDLISAAGGRSCNTPLVLLTGQFGWVVEQQGIEAGAVDFVDKNILSPQLLRRVIGYAQQNHGTARELVANLESYRNIAQSAARANTQKSQFFAEMSHELRTPLNAIIGFSEILKEQLLGPHEGEAATRYTGYAGDIYVSSQHLLHLINDLLDLSKFEAGEMEAVMSAASVDDLLEDLVMMTATQAGKAGVGVTIQHSADIEHPVIDRRLILQALLNVTSNAIKFSDAGDTVHVSVDVLGGGMVLKVADTGCGISAEDLETVMLPYRQGNAMKTRPGGGTGLGLALTSSILELHQGHISIESEEDVGTTVTMHLPGQISLL
jgi:signal transduction histidine kinase